MSAIPGTPVTAPIVPSDTSNTNPTHLEQYGFGGIRTVPTYAAMLAIPSTYRTNNMRVTVNADESRIPAGSPPGTVGPEFSYSLNADLVTWLPEGDNIGTSQGPLLGALMSLGAGNSTNAAAIAAETQARVAAVNAEAQLRAAAVNAEATARDAAIAAAVGGINAGTLRMASGESIESAVNGALPLPASLNPRGAFVAGATYTAAATNTPADVVVSKIAPYNSYQLIGPTGVYTTDPSQNPANWQLVQGATKNDLANPNSGFGVDLVAGAIKKVSNVSAFTGLTVLSDGQRINAFGYNTTAPAVLPDYGGGEFVYSATSTAAVDNFMVFASGVAGNVGRILRILRGTPNVQMAGARDTNLSAGFDSTAAFQAVFAYVLTTVVSVSPNFTGDTDKRLSIGYDIPPGNYLITGDAALVGGQSGQTTHGLQIRGAGLGLTRIDFVPSAANYRLIFNNNRHKFGSFSGMEVNCSGPNANTAMFEDLYSNGGADGFRYEDIVLYGNWQRGWSGRGSNTGSERYFNRCGLGGNFAQAAFYLGPDSNDQFVNYHFKDCYGAPVSGDMLYLYYGGSVIFEGGTLSCPSARTTQGWLFNLPLGDHNNGACKLHVTGLRVEYKASGLMGLLNCAWKQGNIVFDNCHDDISLGVEQPTQITTCNVSTNNATGANIVFRDCRLSGKHLYSASGTGMWNMAPPVYFYERCTIREFASAHDFAVVSQSGEGANTGGLPTVEFRSCTAGAAAPSGITPNNVLFDCVVGWHVSAISRPIVRWQQVLTFDGGADPGSGAYLLYLPRYALIKGFSLYYPAGGTSVPAGCTFTATTNDATPVSLLSYTTTADLNTGLDMKFQKQFQCVTDAQRTILIKKSSSTRQPPGTAFVMVEYVA